MPITSRHEQIVSMLLQMYSSVSSMYVMRAKANTDRSVIHQPCLNLFGTAVPKPFYESRTARLLTNGFLARLLIVECGKRGTGRDDTARPIPKGILETARRWADFQPVRVIHRGETQPDPVLVAHTPDAKDAFRDIRFRADAEYATCERTEDTAGMAVWARAYEKTRRLALVYACSESATVPTIGRDAAVWAGRFVEHQTRRMLAIAVSFACESEFDAKRKRLLDVLTKWRGQKGDAWMPYWKINRSLPWSQSEHEDIRQTLLQQRHIETQFLSSGGRPGLCYRIPPLPSGP